MFPPFCPLILQVSKFHFFSEKLGLKGKRAEKDGGMAALKSGVACGHGLLNHGMGKGIEKPHVWKGRGVLYGFRNPILLPQIGGTGVSKSSFMRSWTGLPTVFI